MILICEATTLYPFWHKLCGWTNMKFGMVKPSTVRYTWQVCLYSWTLQVSLPDECRWAVKPVRYTLLCVVSPKAFIEECKKLKNGRISTTGQLLVYWNITLKVVVRKQVVVVQQPVATAHTNDLRSRHNLDQHRSIGTSNKCKQW